MNDMDNGVDRVETCPRPLRRQDASAVIGLLSIVEGELALDQLDRDVADHLRQRFVSDGLLPADTSGRALRQALADLIQRVHYADGSYDEPPAPMPVPD
jgi:hypothetical protein